MLRANFLERLRFFRMIEPESADDDARPVGEESDEDEVQGIDAERRVPLPEERGAADEG